MAVVTELVTVFGFKGSTKPLADFNVTLSDSILLIGKGVGALGSLGSAFAGFVTYTLSTLDPLVQLSRQTGVAVEAIQELGFAASVSGSSAETLQGSISALGQKIGEAAQKGSEDFDRLGISVRDASGQVKSADVVFGEIGNRFKTLGLSLQEQQGFASALGIDASLIQLLGKTGAEMTALRKKAKDLGVITEEQADATADYNDSLATLKFGLSGIQNQVAVGIAPEFTRLADQFTELLIANKDWIIGGIERAVEVGGSLISTVVRLSPVLAGLGLVFVGLKVATLGWSTALKGIGKIGVIALIIGVVAAVDDLIVAFKGGKSVIADFFDSFFGAGSTQKFLQETVETVKLMAQVSAGFFKFAFEKLFEFIGSGFDKLINVGSKVADFFGFGGDEVQVVGAGAVSGVDGNIPLTSPSAANVATSNVTNNDVNQSNTITVISDSPQQAGEAVNDVLQSQLRDTRAEFSKGGK